MLTPVRCSAQCFHSGSCIVCIGSLTAGPHPRALSASIGSLSHAEESLLGSISTFSPPPTQQYILHVHLPGVQAITEFTRGLNTKSALEDL